MWLVYSTGREFYLDSVWQCELSEMEEDPDQWGGMLWWCGLVLLHEHRPSLQQVRGNVTMMWIGSVTWTQTFITTDYIRTSVQRHSLNSYSTLTSVMHLQFCYEDVCQLIPGLTQWFFSTHWYRYWYPFNWGKWRQSQTNWDFLSVYM